MTFVRKASWLVGCLSVAVAGCSASRASPLPENDLYPLEALATVRGLSEKAVFDMGEQATADCMAALGFTYRPEPYRPPPLPSRPATKEEIEIWGFGFSAMVENKVPPWVEVPSSSSPPLQDLPDDPVQRAPFNVALNGDGTSVEMLDDMGCRGQGGTVGRAPRRIREELGRLMDQRDELMKAAPEILEQNRRLAACWNTAGYDGDPQHIAFDRLNELTAAGGAIPGSASLQEFTQFEIQAAVVAMKCYEGIDDVFGEVQRSIENQLIKDNPSVLWQEP